MSLKKERGFDFFQCFPTICRVSRRSSLQSVKRKHCCFFWRKIPSWRRSRQYATRCVVSPTVDTVPKFDSLQHLGFPFRLFPLFSSTQFTAQRTPTFVIPHALWRLVFNTVSTPLPAVPSHPRLPPSGKHRKKKHFLRVSPK